ncbi:MAG: hypothetical protein K2Q18_06490 [Bdellovibrionales bacterium]|nr:hypothetical protein [Bdellovibrionales bacterium]
MNITEFPAEYFVKLDGQDFLLGRLSINKMNNSYWVEVDIVQKESKKIYAHVGNLYNTTDLDEAVTRSVQMLSNFVRPK